MFIFALIGRCDYFGFGFTAQSKSARKVEMIIHKLVTLALLLSLLEVLPDHLNAEIVAGTITSKQDAMDYLTWTYFFRRLLMNPTYYELENTDNDSVNKFLSGLVENAVREVENSACVEIGEVSEQ